MRILGHIQVRRESLVEVRRVRRRCSHVLTTLEGVAVLDYLTHLPVSYGTTISATAPVPSLFFSPSYCILIMG